MKWVTWYNPNSGNKTTRAHVASDDLDRTECGWAIPVLTQPANLGKIPRCQACLRIVNNKRKEQR